MEIERYLDRIGYEGELSADLKSLKALHRAHVFNVPFEDLDVQFQKPIHLDLPSIYEKVVIRRRGGYCYELNHLFHWLLLEIGYDSMMVSSRIFNGSNPGPEYDHMSLIVSLEESWLVDVGYGDLFIEPLVINPQMIQVDKFKQYKIVDNGSGSFLLNEALIDGDVFEHKYIFDSTARSIDDFAAQNEYKQHHPDSHFVSKMICTLPTEDGRKSIIDTQFKVRKGDVVTYSEVNIGVLVDLLVTEFYMDAEDLNTKLLS